jgi:hypothetical protein
MESSKQQPTFNTQVRKEQFPVAGLLENLEIVPISFFPI